ncbi:MAG: amino acid permease, partial [Bdellovibrionota bacterium]
ILVGYDASAHVTEETENPRTAAPRGILLSVGVSVIVGFVLLAVLTLSIPDLAQAVGYGDNAFSEILKLRLGAPLGMAFVGAILVIVWLCGLATLTSASRMVYAFARDGGLPFSRALARVSPTHQVPANAIWALSALAFSVALSVKLYSAVVSMAVVAIYLSYGLPILAAFVAGRKLQKGPFTLGRLSPLVRGVALLWVAFITVVFVLPPNEQSGEVLAVAVSGLAILWFARVRKRFRGPANQ